MKVLLIRLDKIGDLISTMCVDQILADTSEIQIHWVIARGLSFVPNHAIPRRDFSEFNKDKKSLSTFIAFIKNHKPDVAVSFQAPWWVNYALWKCGVPVRAGVLSQWHSYLFLNKGLRQKRSEAIKHEADYNRELLEFALDLKTNKMPTPILKLKAHENQQLLQRHGLTEKNYIVVHAGMAGSALNWPVQNYIQYIEVVSKIEQVVLTGTMADEPWLTEIKAHFAVHPKVLCLQSKLTAPELLTLLENAKRVIVPSTGVAHLAASLGTSVVGIYSPIKVQHPTRWAARGAQVQILVPEISSASEIENCMKKISVDQVLKL